MVFSMARVKRVRRLSPQMARVCLEGGKVPDMPVPCADAYVKLFFPREGQDRPQLPEDMGDSWYQTYLGLPEHTRPIMRTYTIRAHRGEEVDIDFVLHEEPGPAGDWAREARPGAEIAILGSGGIHTVPSGTDWQLLIGDQAALPAIGAIVEGLEPGTITHAYIEVDNPAEEQDFTTDGDLRVHWIHRGDRPHGQALLDAVRDAEFPAGEPYGWISGESAMIKAARRHLVQDRGYDKSRVSFTGYWRRGVTHDNLA